MLPDAALATAQSNNLLVLSLDQGSVGAAGIAFAESIGMMSHAKWDKFHRLMRDINLTLSSVSGGVFLKYRIFSTLVGFEPQAFWHWALRDSKNVDAECLHVSCVSAEQRVQKVCTSDRT